MSTRFFIPILLLIAACTNGKRDIRDYYFPVLDLQGGQVYVFETREADTVVNEYWYYRGFVRDSGIFFTATYYNPGFEIGQIVREKMVDNGALTREVFLYETDTATEKQIQIPTVIGSPNAFPFQVSDSLGVFLYSINYKPLFDTAATIYLVRNRSYLGDGPDFELEGRQYPTVMFKIREAIGSQKEGNAEVEGTGVEHYAKELGLVYYQKTYGSGFFSIEGKLKERISMQELEKRAKK